MRLVLDTHALVWWLTDDPKLSKSVTAAIADPGNEIVTSAVSGWEMATKARLQRWPEAQSILADLETTLENNRIGVLPVLMRDAVLAGSLAGRHQDPFDRMIAAQVLSHEDLRLVTIDPAFSEFGVRCFW